jgi:uncharacterized membrane protein
MNKPHPEDPDIMLEYDFTGAVRGKYAKLFPVGVRAVVLDPDVAKLFPDSESVNRALRALGQIISEQARAKPKKRAKQPVAAE